MRPQVVHTQHVAETKGKELRWLIGAWLALVIVAVIVGTLATNNEQVITAATIGTAITFGGLYLVYTWVVAVGINEREKLRRSLDALETRLEDAKSLARTLSRSDA